jgi:hypothetical protein
MKLFGWRLVRDSRVDTCQMCDHCSDVGREKLCEHNPAHEFVVDCIIADDPILPKVEWKAVELADYTRSMSEPGRPVDRRNIE